MSRRTLHHLGIAVPSLEMAIPQWTSLIQSGRVQRDVDPDQGVEVAFLQVGGAGIELLAPLRSTSVVARFLERRGPGLHHICFEVPDLRAAMAELSSTGIDFTEPEPRTGAFGHLVAFIHPRSAGGVLTELLQAAEAVGTDYS